MVVFVRSYLVIIYAVMAAVMVAPCQMRVACLDAGLCASYGETVAAGGSKWLMAYWRRLVLPPCRGCTAPPDTAGSVSQTMWPGWFLRDLARCSMVRIKGGRLRAALSSPAKG